MAFFRTSAVIAVILLLGILTVAALPPMPTRRTAAVSVEAGGKIGGHLAFAAGGGHALDAPQNEVFEFSR